MVKLQRPAWATVCSHSLVGTNRRRLQVDSASLQNEWLYGKYPTYAADHLSIMVSGRTKCLQSSPIQSNTVCHRVLGPFTFVRPIIAWQHPIGRNRKAKAHRSGSFSIRECYRHEKEGYTRRQFRKRDGPRPTCTHQAHRRSVPG